MPIDCLLTEHRDTEAARHFLQKAIRPNGLPETITIDGSDANAAAITSDNQAYGTAVTIRQVHYLKHVVEQAHRAVKRSTPPLLGCTSFEAAQSTLGGLERMHMLKKRQRMSEAEDEGLIMIDQCYIRAAY